MEIVYVFVCTKFHELLTELISSSFREHRTRQTRVNITHYSMNCCYSVNLISSTFAVFPFHFVRWHLVVFYVHIFTCTLSKRMTNRNTSNSFVPEKPDSNQVAIKLSPEDSSEADFCPLIACKNINVFVCLLLLTLFLILSVSQSLFPRQVSIAFSENFWSDFIGLHFSFHKRIRMKRTTKMVEGNDKKKLWNSISSCGKSDRQTTHVDAREIYSHVLHELHKKKRAERIFLLILTLHGRYALVPICAVTFVIP